MASPNKKIRHLRAVGQRPDRLEQLALLHWLQESDDVAFAEFYEATSGLLFGLLLHALRDTATAEEVLARVYADLKQEASQFDSQRNSLLVWLLTTAHWRVHESLQSSFAKQRRPVLIGPRERGNPVRNLGMDRIEHQRQISSSLSSLLPAQLRMIELAYFSRMAPVEIALRLGQRLETVKVGLHDGMSQLCRLFKREFPPTTLKIRLSRIA